MCSYDEKWTRLVLECARAAAAYLQSPCVQVRRVAAGILHDIQISVPAVAQEVEKLKQASVCL